MIETAKNRIDLVKNDRILLDMVFKRYKRFFYFDEF